MSFHAAMHAAAAALAGGRLEVPNHVECRDGAPRPRCNVTIGRYADLHGISVADGGGDAYAEHAAYDAIGLGAGAIHDHLQNSVLLIPDLISPEECAQLIADVEKHHAALEEAGEEEDDLAKHQRQVYGGAGGMFYRYRIPQLSEETVALFDVILRERLLPFISKELPAVADMVYTWSEAAATKKGSKLDPIEPRCEEATLASLPLRYAPEEPAINRYTEGGYFAPHTDQQALTLNVLLAPEGPTTFVGGGTAFWREDMRCKLSTLRVQPQAGVGVVFNGTVKHAGRPVVSGLRHLLVCSFSICAPTYVSNANKRVPVVASAQTHGDGVRATAKYW